MILRITGFIFTALLLGCTSGENKTLPYVVIDDLEVSEFEFSCEEDLVVWSGGLQEIKESDSTCCFTFSYCMGDDVEDSYEVIAKPNANDFVSLSKEDKLNALHASEKKDFKLFAFSIEEKINDEPEDEFDVYEYQFPFSSEVRVFLNDEWYFVEEREVNNLTEFSLFKKEYLYKEFK